MSLLPEWAPNIHPVLIHFPIVLLLLAPLLDVGTILFKKQQWLQKNANLIYALAGLSVLIVYISGRIAADSVDLPSSAYVTLSTHADWALYTLILGGLNGLWRGFRFFRNDDEQALQWYLIVPGLIVAGLLFFTADNGAKLVYGHGVGVSVAQPEDHHQAEAEEHSHASSAGHSHAEEMTQTADSHEAEPELGNDFEWIIGDAASVHLKENDASQISLSLDNQEVLFVLPETYTNLEFTARVNRDKFNGSVRLVHHVSDANNYDLLELSNSTVSQGRVKNGKLITFDSDEYAASNWISLKVVGTKGHFRGYVNQKMITHGHGADLAPGKLGVYIKGTGLIQVDKLQGVELK